MSLLAEDMDEILDMGPSSLKSLGFHKASLTDDSIKEHPHKWVKAVAFDIDHGMYCGRYHTARCTMYYFDDRKILYTLFRPYISTRGGDIRLGDIISTCENKSISNSLDMICAFNGIAHVIKREFCDNISEIRGLNEYL